jgi:hypothetical protein
MDGLTGNCQILINRDPCGKPAYGVFQLVVGTDRIALMVTCPECVDEIKHRERLMTNLVYREGWDRAMRGQPPFRTLEENALYMAAWERGERERKLYEGRSDRGNGIPGSTTGDSLGSS